MFEIDYDRGTHLLRFALRGLWTMADVERFAAAMLATVQTIPADRRDFAVLSETGDFPVQTAEVSKALGHIMEVAERMNSGRKAIVVGTMLNKLQAERTLAQPNVRVFLNADQACAWLAAPGEDRR